MDREGRLTVTAGGSSAIDRTNGRPGIGRHGIVLRWSVWLLVAASWVSGAIFAAYILAFFGGVALKGSGHRWNEALPGLHDAGSLLTAVAIGAHFIAGGVLLVLGPIQLIGRVRRAAPALHRGLGRAYVVSAGVAGLGGLVFIAGKGTIGGPLMDVGFGLYGGLMVACAAMVYGHARRGDHERHRAWAIRLFALTIGSWLYRMEYGLWSVLFGSLGRGAGFSGWFDAVMVFFFYAPNLVIAETFIRVGRKEYGLAVDLATAALLLAAAIFVTVATSIFTTSIWGPRMVSAFS